MPPPLRGTYAGLAHDAVTGYLRDLGVTTVELLPVHESVPESFLVERGLTNYWGYNTIGYFAPHQAYSAAVRAGQPGGQVAEFKAMVNALHRAGLEVLLDVVFNHTAEGSQLGPTLCFRGLDNPAYYRLDEGDPRSYYDTTGTGNSLNTGDPVTLRLIMDSLRYWVTQMHVDGFRFDLAATLGRQDGGFAQVSAFFDLVAQDPVVSQVKLVAEPWDVGQMDSYDLGRFPPLWREWNGRYRDTMRDFWRSHPVGLPEFATRFCGSADLYAGARRRPTASVNLITVHDGFTLRDLVSYNDKHNEANGEANRDGTTDNRSWNCGTEGPTADPAILALRARQSRAMLATLLLSFGVPLLLGGDEIGRTQLGNNNAYCQDNELTWFDWDGADHALLGFTRQVIALRKAHPVFRRRRFLAGAETADLRWFIPAGSPMSPADWADGGALAVALYLDGSDAPDRAADGAPLLDDDFLVLVNAWWEPLDFVLPETRPGARVAHRGGHVRPGRRRPGHAGRPRRGRPGRGQARGRPPLGRGAAQPPASRRWQGQPRDAGQSRGAAGPRRRSRRPAGPRPPGPARRRSRTGRGHTTAGLAGRTAGPWPGTWPPRPPRSTRSPGPGPAPRGPRPDCPGMRRRSPRGPGGGPRPGQPGHPAQEPPAGEAGGAGERGAVQPGDRAQQRILHPGQRRMLQLAQPGVLAVPARPDLHGGPQVMQLDAAVPAPRPDVLQRAAQFRVPHQRGQVLDHHRHADVIHRAVRADADRPVGQRVPPEQPDVAGPGQLQGLVQRDARGGGRHGRSLGTCAGGK